MQLWDVDVYLPGWQQLLDHSVVDLWDGNQVLLCGSFLSHFDIDDDREVDLVFHGDALQSVYWSLHRQGKVAHVSLVHVNVVDNRQLDWCLSSGLDLLHMNEVDLWYFEWMLFGFDHLLDGDEMHLWQLNWSLIGFYHLLNRDEMHLWYLDWRLYGL